MIDTARRLAKTYLKAFPRLRALLKPAYEAWKARDDAKRVRQRRPDVEISHYSTSEVQATRAEGFHSQFGQDHYLATHVFTGKNDGVFLDIGCNAPTHNNNSLYFERLGWRGHAFDPLTLFEKDWQRERSAPFHCAAISDTEGERDFVEFLAKGKGEHQYSGFKDTVRPEDLEIHEHIVRAVRCGPVRTFVPDLDHVDIAFIDVEGAEEFVVRGLNLDDLRIDWILLENAQNVGGAEPVRRLLEGYGYRMRARIAASDDLFERNPPAV